jgi:hypothetical protein
MTPFAEKFPLQQRLSRGDGEIYSTGTVARGTLRGVSSNSVIRFNLRWRG